MALVVNNNNDYIDFSSLEDVDEEEILKIKFLLNEDWHEDWHEEMFNVKREYLISLGQHFFPDLDFSQIKKFPPKTQNLINFLASKYSNESFLDGLKKNRIDIKIPSHIQQKCVVARYNTIIEESIEKAKNQSSLKKSYLQFIKASKIFAKEYSNWENSKNKDKNYWEKIQQSILNQKSVFSILPNSIVSDLIESVLQEYQEKNEKVNQLTNKRSKLMNDLDKLDTKVGEINSIESIKNNPEMLEMLEKGFNQSFEKIEEDINVCDSEKEKCKEDISVFKEAFTKIRGTSDYQVPDHICNICCHRQRSSVLGCGHYFCESCISQLNNNKCPNCNKVFSPHRIIKLYH